MSNQGASGVLNERTQGDDRKPLAWRPIITHFDIYILTPPLRTLASWFDHSRDLLHMINLFRSEMPRPIVGIGHSLGAAEMSFSQTPFTPGTLH